MERPGRLRRAGVGGQQAFIGFGAYATICFTQHGVTPYLAVVLARVARPLAAVVSLLVLRLRGGQFAVGTWVVAEALAFWSCWTTPSVAAPASRCGAERLLPRHPPRLHLLADADFTVLLLALVFLLLRRRTGAALQAIRDDEEAAASLGVRVRPLKFLLFVLAGFGCGAAGALILANTLFIQPQSIFGVQYSAYMIFMVLVGGLGTFEGPIIGAIVFFVIQYEFADQGPGTSSASVWWPSVSPCSCPRGCGAWSPTGCTVQLCRSAIVCARRGSGDSEASGEVYDHGQWRPSTAQDAGRARARGSG